MKRQRTRGLAGSRRGSNILESALVLNAFLLILFGMVEFGMSVYTLNFVKYAARDASRYASVRGSTSTSPATNATITSFVKNQAAAINAANITVTTTWSPNNQPGSTVQVRVACNYSPLLTIVSPNSYVIYGRSILTISR